MPDTLAEPFAGEAVGTRKLSWSNKHAIREPRVFNQLSRKRFMASRARLYLDHLGPDATAFQVIAAKRAATGTKRSAGISDNKRPTMKHVSDHRATLQSASPHRRVTVVDGMGRNRPAP